MLLVHTAHAASRSAERESVFVAYSGHFDCTCYQPLLVVNGWAVTMRCYAMARYLLTRNQHIPATKPRPSRANSASESPTGR